MPTQDYYSTMVYAFLGPNADPSDPETAHHPAIYYTYANLIEIEKDLAKEYKKDETKRRLKVLQDNTNVFESGQKAVVDLIGHKTRASIASSQNRQRAEAAYLKAAQRMHESDTDVNRDAYHTIKREATRRAATTGKDPNVEAALTSVTHSYESVDPVDPNATNIVGTVSALSEEAGLGSLGAKGTREKWVNATKGRADQGNILAEYDRLAEQRAGSHMFIKNSQEAIVTIQNYDKKVPELTRQLQAGAPGARDAILAANQTLAETLGVRGALVNHALSSETKSLELTQQFFQEYLTAQAQYAPALKAISDEIIGRDSGGNLRGKVVSSAAFQEWAADQGYENLGYMSKTGVYVEGADDTDAIAMWQYQKKHPDKYGPGLAGRRSYTGDLLVLEKELGAGQLARLATTDDMTWKEGADFDDVVKGRSGKYIAARKDDGSLDYLSKFDSRVDLARKGGQIVEGADGKTYVVNYEMPPKASKAIDDLLAKIQSGDLDADQTKAAFGLIDSLEKDHKKAFDVIIASAIDGDQLPVELAAQFEIHEIVDGEIKEVRDPDAKLNILAPRAMATGPELKEGKKGKRTAIKMGKAVSGQKLLEAMDVNLAFVDDPPMEEVTVKRKRRHASEYVDGKAPLKGTDAYGREIELDPDTFKVKDAANEEVLGRRARFYQAETAYGKVKAKEMGEEFIKAKSPEKGKSGAPEQRKEKREERKEARQEEQALIKFGKVVGRDINKLEAFTNRQLKGGPRAGYQLSAPTEPQLVGKAQRQKTSRLNREEKIAEGRRYMDALYGEGVMPTATQMRDFSYGTLNSRQQARLAGAMPDLDLPPTTPGVTMDPRAKSPQLLVDGEPVTPKYKDHAAGELWQPHDPEPSFERVGDEGGVLRLRPGTQASSKQRQPSPWYVAEMARMRKKGLGHTHEIEEKEK